MGLLRLSSVGTDVQWLCARRLTLIELQDLYFLWEFLLCSTPQEDGGDGGNRRADGGGHVGQEFVRRPRLRSSIS